MRRRFKAVADAAAFASYVRKQVAKRRAAKEMLARLIQDEPAMRSACEDAFEAPETIDDEQDTRGFEDVVVHRRVSVPESVAVSLPSLKEGDEEAVEEGLLDANSQRHVKEHGVRARDGQVMNHDGRWKRDRGRVSETSLRIPDVVPGCRRPLARTTGGI